MRFGLAAEDNEFRRTTREGGVKVWGVAAAAHDIFDEDSRR